MSQASKPGTLQAQNLADLNATIKTHNDDRTLYQGLLAGSQGTKGEAPGLSHARPSGGTNKSGIDTSGQVEIRQQELAKAEQRLINGDTRAQGDIDSLKRELSRLPGGLASARPAGGQGAPAAMPVQNERPPLESFERPATLQRTAVQSAPAQTPLLANAAQQSPKIPFSSQQGQPTPPTAQPQRMAGEGLQAFKQRLVDWDKNRMAYDDMVSSTRISQQREAQRLAALAGRPDLARMGAGLR